jgi:hypothetical protein
MIFNKWRHNPLFFSKEMSSQQPAQQMLVYPVDMSPSMTSSENIYNIDAIQVQGKLMWNHFQVDAMHDHVMCI